MTMFLLIGVPIFFILAVFVGVMSFAAEEPPVEDRAAVSAREAAARAEGPTAVVPGELVSGSPLTWSTGNRTIAIDEAVASIEEHLRHEQVAAQAFARDPSTKVLWLN